MDFLKMIVAALGLSDNTAENEVLKQVIQMSDKNRALDEVNAALVAERDQLKNDYDALKATIDSSEKDSLLSAAVSEKRITAKEKETFAKLEIADVKALLGERKAPVSPMAFINVGDAADGSDKWTFTDWTKNNPVGLASMKRDDTERYKRLFKAQYGTEPS